MAGKESITTANESFAWTKDELATIKSKCPKNWASKISSELGIGEGTIRNVMNGFKQNDEVVLLALKIADEHQALLNQAKQKIAQL